MQNAWSGRLVRGVLLILLCLVLLSLAAGRARGAEPVASGSCGDNLTWTLDGEGVLTISGTGEMWDNYTPPSAANLWYPYVDQIKGLVIEKGVTGIGNNAFQYCRNLTGSLVFPDSVRTIGSSAFVFCEGLNGTLTIPEGVVSIGDYAFSNCSGLTGDLILPDSITSIGRNAFGNCRGLNGRLELPGHIESIAEAAFTYCSGLTGTLTIPEGVTEISDHAFSFCSGLTGDLIIPDSVTEIGAYAFYACYGLNGTLELPAGITRIRENTFNACSKLTGDLTIPDGVTAIEYGAFNGCGGFTGSLTIPNGVTEIGDSAFFMCSGLTGSLTIPNSVSQIGSSAFSGCGGLTGDLTIPDSVTGIGTYAFSGCSGLTGSLTISRNLRTIPSGAFSTCMGLTGDLVIPDGVAEIGSSAFSDCVKLDGALTIPDSVLEIGEYAFARCERLSGTLVLPDSITEIKPYTFYNCGGLTGDLIIPDSIVRIGERAFGDCAGFDGVLRLPKDILAVEDYAFSGCSGLSGTLEIPDGVTSIGEAAFLYCGGFTGKLELPEHLAEIGPYAFNNCTGFTGTLDIPAGVVSIGGYAFSQCTGLTNVRFEGNAPTQIGSNAFQGITLYVPRGDYDWTVPEWNGYSTAWYTPSGTATLGAAASKFYIPTGVTTGGTADPNRVRRTQIRFWAGLAPEGYQEVPMEIPWGWKLFWQDTVHYDNRLAIAALALSSAIEGSGNNVISLLKTLGFQKTAYYEYDTLVTRDVTHAIAGRRVQMDGEDWDIFAVVSRGTGNGSDILTDLLPGGFYDAAENTWENVQSYLMDYYGVSSMEEVKGRNMKFFVTGHSLGGAVANLLSPKIGALVPSQNVFVYTFASPNTWSYQWSLSNVYNIVNREDLVPLLSPAFNGYRIGADCFFYRKNINQLNTAFLMLVNGGQTGAPGLDYIMEAKPSELLNMITGTQIFNEKVKWNYAHSTVTYMAYLLTRSDADELWNYGIRKAAIHCPVDVEVYNSAGELVGRVVDNQVDETVIQEVFFVLNGDEKDVYMPLDDEYTFVLTGNDTGTMRYTVTETDPATGKVTEKSFSDVVLMDGKTMTSEAGGDIPPAEVQLFVVDEASAPSAEVSTSGEETETGDRIPVTAITGVPAHMVKGESVTLAGVVRPSYAGEREITWELTDPGTTGASLTGNVLTAFNSGTLTLTAAVPGGLATGADFTQTFSLTVTEPPALSAPSLLEWEGKAASWNFVDNVSGFRVQLYRDGNAVGEAITTTALSWDFSGQMTVETADYTFTVTSLGDGRAYSDSPASEVSAPYRSARVSFRSVADGAVSVQVQLNENFGVVELLVARYDNGRMTAAYQEQLSASRIVEADLSVGSGAEYRAFLLKAGTYVPLCEGAEY